MAKSRRERRKARGVRSKDAQRQEEPLPRKLAAPSTEYSDDQGNVLTLRGSLTIGARQEYARTLGGHHAHPGTSREDNEQRAFELLFERLAMRWEIAGAPIEHQRELLARLRAATANERAFVRRALRAHCAENFPELQAP